MLFNSYLFIFAFLPIILVGYFWLLKKRLIFGSKLWLVGGSLFFYGYWSVIYIPLLLLSIFVNYFIGNKINLNNVAVGGGKNYLIFGIFFNIALLSYFKYTDFFLSNFNSIFDANVPLSHIILPLGISFFTFT